MNMQTFISMIPLINAIIFLLHISQLIVPSIAIEASVYNALAGNIFTGDEGTGICEYSIGNYTRPSAYQSDLSAAFSDLTAASADSKIFSNVTAGEVHASFYCLCDVDTVDCHECVRNTTRIVFEKCSTKAAIVYSSNCVLHYSNSLQFIKDDSASLLYCVRNRPTIPDSTSFNRSVTTIMERLINRANFSGSYVNSTDYHYHYSVENLEWLVDQKVYTAIRCVPGTISGSECKNCLLRALNEMQGCLTMGKSMGIDARPHCWMRYDIDPFGDFALSPAPTPEPSSSNISPSASPNSAKNRSNSPGARIIMFVIATALSVIVVNYIGA